MSDHLYNDIRQHMVLLPEGSECVRDFIDEEKWMSSNSQMSMPGTQGSMTEVMRTIKISPFYMSRYTVTGALYHTVMQKASLTELSLEEADAELPAVNVSWFDAVRFCNLLSRATNLGECYIIGDQSEEVLCNWNANGYRLPTEAEWQYACRAGSSGYRYGEIDQIAWCRDNSEGKIHRIGEKTPNLWGLYDMLGNVWEWCWDLYDEKRYGSYRVFRGGSWAEEARACGATSRRRSHPSFRIDDLGFRIARSV